MPKAKKSLKQFIVRKYIMAVTAVEAIANESKYAVDDVWVDEEWRKENFEKMGRQIGFKNKK